jgi:leucine rich repeat domain protein
MYVTITALDLSKNTNLSLVDISKVENFTIAQKEALAQSLPQKPGAVIVLSRFDPSEGDANNQKVLDLIGAKKWVAKRRHIIDKEKFVAFNGKLYPYIKTIDLGWAANPNIDTEREKYVSLYTQLSKGEKFKFKSDYALWIDLNNNGQQDKGEAIEYDSDKEKSFVADSPVITIYGGRSDLNISNNKIKAVDASHLRTLERLDLSNNSLTQLILNENRREQPNIREINIMNNQLNKATMEAIAKSLPEKENYSRAKIILQDLSSGSPKSNEISPEILSIIREKNFTPCYYKYGKVEPYK